MFPEVCAVIGRSQICVRARVHARVPGLYGRTMAQVLFAARASLICNLEVVSQLFFSYFDFYFNLLEKSEQLRASRGRYSRPGLAFLRTSARTNAYYCAINGYQEITDKDLKVCVENPAAPPGSGGSCPRPCHLQDVLISGEGTTGVFIKSV